MEIWVIISFLIFMLFFAGVGLASIRVKKDTTDDYLVAGRGMHPALAALSAVSTWNSGYMFIGFIGFMWMMGYSAIWISIVSTIGQLVAWVWLYKHIQQEAKDRNLRSLSSLVGNFKGSPEAKLAAVLSVAFLLIYAGAQLSSGGKALFVMLDWHQGVGILIGFVMVVAYCYAGGIRASIWTDAAQSCVMIVGSTLLAYVALGEVGGFSGLHSSLNEIDPALTSITPPGLKLGLSMWIFAFFLGGLGVAGQPQVVSRIMTLESDEDRKKACIWFFVWQTPFLILMVLIGLASRVIFPVEGSFDPELALPMLAMDVLGPFWVGLILASIFAASMSTADSQVLACTAAIVDDIFPQWSEDHKKTKLATMGMAFAATCISLGALATGNNSVFTLVVLAVYGLGSMFIPLLIIRFTGFKPDSKHSIIMMLSALFAVILWRVTGLNQHIFESVPGMAAAFIAHFVMVFKNRDPWLMDRIPQPKKIAAGIGVLLVIIVPTEVYYLYNAPVQSETIDDNSPWQLNLTFDSSVLNQSIMVGDGETQNLVFDIPADAIAIRLSLYYDETNEGGVLTDCDDIAVEHDLEAFPQGFESQDFLDYSGSDCGLEIDMGSATINSTIWSPPNEDGVLINGTFGLLNDLLDLAQTQKEAGEVTENITVTVNRGFFLNGDSGEEITISARVWTLDSFTLVESN